MTVLLLLVLFVASIWLMARVSDLSNELKRLRAEIDALKGEFRSKPEVTREAIEARPPAQATEVAPVVEDMVARERQKAPPRLVPLEQVPAVPVESLESRIGGRWLLYIGMATILVGASYFVKLAIDNEWITPVMRLFVGAITGLLLIASGPVFRRRGYALYGQILAGGGLAILYICVYAAFNYYALIASTPAFALMVVVTAGAAFIADRENSQGLALMAAGGGFLTPFLVSSGRDAQVALFTYDAILIGGTMVLARRRNWPALNAVSFVLTVATLTVWATVYYSPDRWLTTYLFLTLFVSMFIYIRHESRRQGTPAAVAVSYLLILAPVLYHLFSLALLSDHGTVLLAYLVVATAAGLWVNARADAGAVRLILWFAIMLPFFAWASENRSWPVMALCATAVAIYAMHSAAQAVVVSREGQVSGFDLALLYVNAVGLYIASEIALEHRMVAVLPVVALVMAVWNGGLAAGLRGRGLAVWEHLGVLAAAFGAIAVARQFDGPAKPVGWAVIASGLLWLGRGQSRQWLRLSGAALLVIAIGQLVSLLASPAPVSQLVLFNPRALATLFVVGLMFVLARAYRSAAEPGTPAKELRAALVVTAHLLALVLITAEIRAFWNVRAPGRSGFLALHVMTSLAWAVYAVGLIVGGIRGRYAPVRYLAMAVFAVTILKVFLLDVAELEQAYRVLSAVGLGVLLLVASFLYQRFKPGEG